MARMIAALSAATLIFHTDPQWRERLAEVVAADLSFVLAEPKRDAVIEVESALLDLGVFDGRYDVFRNRMNGTVQGLLY